MLRRSPRDFTQPRPQLYALYLRFVTIVTAIVAPESRDESIDRKGREVDVRNRDESIPQQHHESCIAITRSMFYKGQAIRDKI